MKFKKGDMVYISYDRGRDNNEIPINAPAMVHGLDEWINSHPGTWWQDRIGDEVAYEITVLDPAQDIFPSHWAWEHELRRMTTCPMTST